MKSKKCIIKGCCNECLTGRRYCLAHYRERKRVQARQHYIEYGRYMYDNKCEACHREYKAWRKEQRFCRECGKQLASYGTAVNGYEPAGGGGYCWKHRRIAEGLLRRKLKTNEVVHHLDCDKKNNEVTNLIVISRGMHFRLHKYLNEQRVILEKSKLENIENCWKSLIVPMTTTWLETTSVNVIKLWEIGKAAAEPLNAVAHEEGSETMHDAPKCNTAQGDDMAQTATQNSGK